MPSGRAAAALGNLLFVPMFLLGGGGPPREVMTGPMQTLSDVLPLTHVVGGIRQAWLGPTDDPHLPAVAGARRRRRGGPRRARRTTSARERVTGHALLRRRGHDARHRRQLAGAVEPEPFNPSDTASATGPRA